MAFLSREKEKYSMTLRPDHIRILDNVWGGVGTQIPAQKLPLLIDAVHVCPLSPGDRVPGQGGILLNSREHPSQSRERNKKSTTGRERF